MSIESDPKRCPKCGATIPTEAPQELCPKCLLLEASIPTETGQGAQGKSAPPSHAELAAAFPQLEILELIGQGGMGFVFKARQPKLDRFVALKILPQSLADDPAFAERFTREGRVLAKLNHPNIVTIHDFGQANGFFYLLMEFVDGVNLRQAMKVGRFTPAQALAVVPKICEALQFAHNEGILHRDIKPENILLDARGRVKIADFGIAKLVGAEAAGRAGSPLPAADARGDDGAYGETRPTPALTETGKVLGTPHYMAPEQLEKPGDVDHRADIYSLGVVFYEMLTGELPIGRFAPPSEKSGADPRVDEVVFHALEKERERRTQTAGEVKTQVETIASSTGAKVLGKSPAAVASATTSVRRANPGMAGHLRRGKQVGLLVFVLTVVVVTFITFIIPDSYMATARIKLEQVAPSGSEISPSYDPYMIQTEVEVIQSDFTVLSRVIENLKLDERWGRRIANRKLKPAEAIGLLMARLDIRPLRNTQLLQIRASSDSPTEAAEIANAVVESYRAFNQNQIESYYREHKAVAANSMALVPVHKLVQVEIVSLAVPPLRPSSPNISLDIVIGILLGAVLGLFLGGMAAFLAALKSRLAPEGGGQIQLPRSSGSGWKIAAIIVAGVMLILVIAAGLLLSHRAAHTSRPQEQAAQPIATNVPPASAETWSPTLAPGEKPDFMKILDDAKALMEQGRYEESLQRHIWYFNHSRNDAGQKGVRVSFALADWIELGRRYPKAKQALIEIRDHDAREFSEGRGYSELFLETSSLNRELQDDGATLALFKTIHQQDKQLAGQCYYYAEDLLMQKGEYELCLNCIGDPQAHFESIRRSWEMQRNSQQRMEEMRKQYPVRAPRVPIGAFAPPDMGQMATNNFVGQVCKLVEILVATDHKADAEKIHDQAVALLDDARLKSAVSDAEERIKKIRTPIAIYQQFVESPTLFSTNLSKPSASVERGSPTLAPGEKPDFQKILDEAKDLMSKGDYEEALQHYLWYFNHSRNDAGQKGVRLSFALSDWIELGRRYPKARQALIEIRDGDARELSKGRGYLELFTEVSSINTLLGDEEATYALFKSIGEQDKKLAQQCYDDVVEPMLVQRGEYELCMSYISDPQKKFESIRQWWERMKKAGKPAQDVWRQRVERMGEMAKTPNSIFPNGQVLYPPDLREFADAAFVGQTLNLIEILVGTGHREEAEKIRDQAVAILDDPRLKSAISDAEEKIRNKLVQTEKK
jgi:serine/threonine protein kinase